MNKYTLGTKVNLSVAFTVSGVATDPTTVTFKIAKPDGMVTTYVYGTDAALVKDSTGNYHVAYTLALEGCHTYRFEGTGAVVAAGEDQVFVPYSPF